MNLTEKDWKRFWSYVQRAEGCWFWVGAKNTKGYGILHVRPRVELAHRLAYQALKGEIPIGLCLDHLCRQPSCVNPDHLEVTTVRENTLRGMGSAAINARKTHCPKGHPLVKGNLVIRRARPEKRECKTCAYERTRLYRQTRQSRHREGMPG
jgi:hypothetical protein